MSLFRTRQIVLNVVMYVDMETIFSTLSETTTLSVKLHWQIWCFGVSGIQGMEVTAVASSPARSPASKEMVRAQGLRGHTVILAHERGFSSESQNAWSSTTGARVAQQLTRTIQFITYVLIISITFAHSYSLHIMQFHSTTSIFVKLMLGCSRNKRCFTLYCFLQPPWALL